MFRVSASRPSFLVPALAAAGLLLAGTLAACSDRADPEGTPRRVAREIDRTLTTVARNELARDPELATRLGLPESATGYRHSAYLTDRSQAAFERSRLARLETRDLLVRVTRPARGSALARHLDTVIAAHETAETLFMPGHGTSALGASYPYVADHTRGAYLDVPGLLVRMHPLNTPEDAHAFIDRMAQFADAVEDDRRRLEADALAGIVPPAPILRRMLVSVTAITAASPETSPVLVRFEALLPSISGLSEDERSQLLGDARRIYASAVMPAYQGFAESLALLANNAPELPGVWQLPGGPAYYAAALRAYSGDDASAAGLHERGRREVEARLVELDRALASAGLADGSVGERLAFLADLQGQAYADSEDGRAALIERLGAHAAAASGALSAHFDFRAPGPVNFVILPTSASAQTALAAYRAPSANGSAPARVELNLSRPGDWPDFRLAAIAFHYVVPGHHLEHSAALDAAGLPLVRQLIRDVPYSEGWASYAETLADELGLYSDDPLSRIGYLQSMLLGAARLVADTGIHNERWGRDEAIAYLVETAGLSPPMAATEVDRFSVRPGHGAAYWLGRERFLDLRERAIRVLGPRFDAKAFHRVILAGGPRPLAMVDEDVTRWYTALIEE